MKVKLFVRDKSMFVGWRRYLEALEDEVNAWLADHPGIRIAHITQSSNGGSFDTSVKPSDPASNAHRCVAANASPACGRLALMMTA